MRRLGVMEDQFARRAQLPPFVFGPGQTHLYAPKSEKKVIYVKINIQTSDETRRKAYFQIRSIPSGFRITEAYPEWSWNEVTHILTAEYEEKMVKAAIQLEEQNGMNRIVVLVVVETANAGKLMNATYFHVGVHQMDTTLSLKYMCDNYPAQYHWFASKGSGSIELRTGESRSIKHLTVAVEEEIVVGIRVYQVEIKIETKGDRRVSEQRTTFLSWFL